MKRNKIKKGSISLSPSPDVHSSSGPQHSSGFREEIQRLSEIVCVRERENEGERECV